jgi:hypothetical protein
MALTTARMAASTTPSFRRRRTVAPGRRRCASKGASTARPSTTSARPTPAAADQFGNSTFDSPAGNVVGDLIPEPQPSELEIHLRWAGNVSNGQTSPTTVGSLVAPAGTASAGQTWCITQGAIGFADGGSEDGVFKFKVSELRAGADWGMGEVMPVELRGCYGSELSD